MNPNSLSLGLIVVFMGVLVFCQYRMLNARKQLTVEQKAKLLDVYSQLGKWHIAVIFITFAVCFAITQYNKEPLLVLVVWPLFILLVILLKTWRGISGYRQLKAAAFPQDYLKSIIFYSFISYIAVIGFIATLIFLP